MKKKFKNTKVGKALGKVFNGAVDVLPLGSTVKGIIATIVNKKFDRNQDGRVTVDDFKPVELIGAFVALIILSILASKGVIDVEILKEISGVLGF